MMSYFNLKLKPVITVIKNFNKIFNDENNVRLKRIETFMLC